MSTQEKSGSKPSSSSSSTTKPSSLVADEKAIKDEEPVEFVALSRSLHIYRPKKEGKGAAAAKALKDKKSSAFLYPIETKGGVTPDAVIIMGWLNAPLRIVLKYAAPYAKLFPEATIIIKLSVGMSMMASQKAKEGALQGLIKVLEEVQASSEARGQLLSQVAELEKSGNQAGLRMDVDSQNRLRDEADNEEDHPPSQVRQRKGIIIHSFSDGGAYNLSQLLRLFKDRNIPPASAMIFDCSPGRASPSSGSFAFTIPLAKRPYLRMLASGLIYCYLYFMYTLKWIIGRKQWSQLMREHLNNPKAWMWSSIKAKTEKKASFPPRMYLYSKKDALIDWKAVEDHAKEAAKLQGLTGPIQVDELDSQKDIKSKGVVVVRRWEGAQHCDLGRNDFDGYWTAIRKFLQATL